MTRSGRKRESITEALELEIIGLIDNWEEKSDFSREALVRRVRRDLGLEFSRQGLMKRDTIRRAFERREREIHGGAKARTDKEPLTVILERRIEELNAAVEQKANVIDAYQNLFVTHLYNARRLGFTREQIEAPMPPRNQPEGSRG